MILSEPDIKLFYRLMWALQFFVNQQKEVATPINTMEEYIALPTEKKKVVRDAMWKQPDLIDRYVNINPNSLPEEDLEILRLWRKQFLAGQFFIFRHLKKGTIFIKDSRVYSVLGLQTELEEIIPSPALPMLVDAVLLPFKGQIIYDGLFSWYSISFGGGYRRSLNEAYTAAKAKGLILTSLDPDAENPKPAPKRKTTDLDMHLKDMVMGLEKLKGNTTLQSAAITLARASLEVALAAETGEDPEPAARKLRRATTRLGNLLDRDQEF